MANIEINDLNEEITISEEEIKHVNGGAGYIKIGDIQGESLTSRLSTSYTENDSKGKPIEYFGTPRWKI